MSILFDWKQTDFVFALASCDRDEVTPYVLRYLPKSGKIVDAGCGQGRFVKYLTDRGYDVVGIELSEKTVREMKQEEPSLRILQGDVLDMSFADNSVDGVLSLGVVEHFVPGMEEPLNEIYRVLKPGGTAVITVPSFNLIRQVKFHTYFAELSYMLNPAQVAKRLNIIRRLLGKPPIPKKPFSYNRKKCVPYYRYPLFGDFFSYRLTKKQFEAAVTGAGFTIVESVPICHMDGVYHDFGRMFVSFRNWEFFPNLLGRSLNSLLVRIPFCHNHMHCCVLRKD
jgi:SAM-dependent methyltransferase